MLLLLLVLQCATCQDTLVTLPVDSLRRLEAAAVPDTVRIYDTVAVLDSAALAVATQAAQDSAMAAAVALYNLQLAGLIQGMHTHDTFLDAVAKWAPAVVAVVVGVILIAKCCQRGDDGRDGRDGEDGRDGDDGRDGKDGEHDKHHNHGHGHGKQ